MEPQFKTPVTARIRGSDRSLPPFGDRNQLKTNDKVYGMTPPGVFFLAIFQQTANLKQIYLYDSAICQQLQIDRHHFIVIKNRVYSVFWGFRYVRMYRFCTHVHSKRAKSSHLSDFGCLIQNSDCGFYRCVQFEHAYFRLIKQCAWRIFAVTAV